MGSEGTAVGAAISTDMLPTPRGGDVLFIADKGLKGIVSGWVQCKVDGLARQADQRFTHVAIALNGWLALEAVPAPPTQASAASDSGLAQTFARLWVKGKRPPQALLPTDQFVGLGEGISTRQGNSSSIRLIG